VEQIECQMVDGKIIEGPNRSAALEIRENAGKKAGFRSMSGGWASTLNGEV
jgi:hypothetical protein